MVQSEWWDADCEEKKAEKYKFLKVFRQSNSKEDLYQYQTTKAKFKSLIKRKKAEFQNKLRTNLEQTCHDPSKFWTCIKI